MRESYAIGYGGQAPARMHPPGRAPARTQSWVPCYLPYTDYNRFKRIVVAELPERSGVVFLGVVIV